MDRCDVSNNDADNQSKLAVFSKAKGQACEMFQELKDYLKKVDTIFTGFPERETRLEYGQFSNFKCLKDIPVAREKIHTINGLHEILKRDCMKIVFFGRTSNGKSTVVNAMLHDSILPSSMGHTTNSFIEVKGSKEETITVKQRVSSESKIVEHLDLCDVVSEMNEEKQALIEVSWPCSKCRLLQEEICLLDCPGYNDSFSMDQELCNFCRDADVFVLVINAVSSLSDQDKHYFKEVSKQLSKPNIFILFNWWDKSTSEKPEKQEKIKQQHTARATDFLEKELKVVKETEVRERIFFVSAKEVLKQRKGDTVNKMGFEDRLMEFEEFERKVMTCVSETAVKTKFMTRAESGKDAISELKPELERLFLDAEKIIIQERKELDSADKILEDIFRNVEDIIQTTLKEVDKTVKSTLGTQIARLDKLLDRFSHAFDPKKLEEYKKELNKFVSSQMNEELQSKIQECISRFKNEVESQMCGLSKLCRLLSENHQEENITFEEENFQMPQFPSIATDFNVDINVGLSLKNAKIGKFLLSAGTAAFSKFAQRAFLAALGSTWSGVTIAGVTIGSGALMAAGSLAAVGMGLVAGVRFLISAVSNVTLEGKRESCKRQYVEHVKSYEKELAEWTSILVCGQIERGLTQSMGRLKSRVESDLHQLVSEKRKRLDQEVTNVSNMRTKLDAIEEMFSKFMEEYLKK